MKKKVLFLLVLILSFAIGTTVFAISSCPRCGSTNCTLTAITLSEPVLKVYATVPAGKYCFFCSESHDVTHNLYDAALSATRVKCNDCGYYATVPNYQYKVCGCTK